jgi:hypothetical protein
MSVASYEFDPCSIDGSDKITLDNWKPSKKEKILPKSNWRKAQNNGNFNQQPGLDELKKIYMHLKRKYPDNQIMDAFGISCETLVAIKRDCYDPVEGISLDNQSKIYKQFAKIEKKMQKMQLAIEYLFDNSEAAIDPEKCKTFKAIMGKRTNPKKIKPIDEED